MNRLYGWVDYIEDRLAAAYQSRDTLRENIKVLNQRLAAAPGRSGEPQPASSNAANQEGATREDAQRHAVGGGFQSLGEADPTPAPADPLGQQ